MKKYFILLSISLVSLLSIAQISINKTPISSTETLSRDVPTLEIASPDMLIIENEDQDASLKGKPYRYAKLIDCDIDPSTNGLWEELDNGVRVWRLNIQSENAKALSLYFDAFWIPSNGELYIYNEDKSKILGAYTNRNNHESGVFAHEIIEGDKLCIEYVQRGAGNPILHIDKISYAYRSIKTSRDLKNFGDSEDCHNNVNCPEGDDWQDVKTAVCRLSIRIGNNSYWCSGSLVNNTAEDCTPYVLTAEHCAYDDDNNNYASSNDMNQWVFYFNYEADICENPSTNPNSNTMTGCSFVSRSSNNGNWGGTSDFYLVELNNSLPFDYGLYVAGWNRSNTASSEGVGIHHPAGDIKKISTYTQSTVSVNSGRDWRVRWVNTESGHGVTEGGSSGSPLLNMDKQIIGDLSTGSSACSPSQFLTAPDNYGKFSESWDQNGSTNDRRLKPWLDPTNSGVISMSGKLCGSPTVANFIAAYTHVKTGLPTQFYYTGTGNPATYNWTFYGNGVTPSNSTDASPVVVYSNDGNYTVRLDVTDAVDNDSYEIKSAYIKVDQFGGSIGIEENRLSVNIFPNPSTGIVYLSQNISNDAEVRVLTLLGKEIYSNTLLETLKIDLSEFNNGVYFIEVRNENSFISERLILNR